MAAAVGPANLAVLRSVALVPADGPPPAARLAAALIEAATLERDPLAEPEATALIAPSTPSRDGWYHTRLAQDVAATLQQETAVGILLNTIASRPERLTQDVPHRGSEPGEGPLVASRTLPDRLRQTALDEWHPDLHALATDLLRLLHPDTREPDLAAQFSPELLTETYQLAVQVHAGLPCAEMSRLARMAQQLIEWEVARLLATGRSMAEIAAQHPRFVRHLEELRWLRRVKARQLEAVRHMRAEGLRDADERQSEAVGLLWTVIRAACGEAGIRPDRIEERLTAFTALLQRIEQEATDLNPAVYPLMQYKRDALQEAIRRLVGPVKRLAIAAQAPARREAPDAWVPTGTPIARAERMERALAGLEASLAYAEATAESYREWLEARTGAIQAGW